MQNYHERLNLNHEGQSPAAGSGSLNIQRIWLYGMLLSFFWELPLFYISNINRINPRWYDIFFLLGLAVFNKKLLFQSIENPVFSAWRNLVVWFGFCAAFYCLLLPFNIGMFSALCAVRYIQGLLVIKMILLVPFSREEMAKIVARCCLVGLGIIAVYCCFEYSSEGGIREIEISPGRYVRTYGNTLFGPLSFSYFHLAQLVPLAGVTLLSCLLWRKKGMVWIGLVLLLCWPLFACGSRTGVGILLVIAVLTILRAVKTQKFGVFWCGLWGVVLLFLAWRYFPLVVEDMTTIARYDEMEHTDINSIEARLGNWSMLLNIARYDHSWLLPFFGGGFNVAPINGGFRIGYGIHNMVLYPLEQGGIIGFVLFFVFLGTAMKTAWQTMNDNALSFGTFAYLLAAVIIGGVGAHNFWREFESGNVNTLIVLVCCLAYMPKGKGTTPDENSADQ